MRSCVPRKPPFTETCLSQERIARSDERRAIRNEAATFGEENRPERDKGKAPLVAFPVSRIVWGDDSCGYLSSFLRATATPLAATTASTAAAPRGAASPVAGRLAVCEESSLPLAFSPSPFALEPSSEPLLEDPLSEPAPELEPESEPPFEPLLEPPFEPDPLSEPLSEPAPPLLPEPVPEPDIPDGGGDSGGGEAAPSEEVTQSVEAPAAVPEEASVPEPPAES